jgi:DNA-binding LacI/PurR family transcriptional regulator
MGTQVYWASPFRTVRQDFQRSAYAAADSLRNGGTRNIVVIGEGPHPEHGVGWEAGFYAAYFADSRIVATLIEVPPELNPEAVVGDTEKLNPDAVMIWGTPSDSRYLRTMEALRKTYPDANVTRIGDPVKGEVCTVLLLQKTG